MTISNNGKYNAIMITPVTPACYAPAGGKWRVIVEGFQPPVAKSVHPQEFENLEYLGNAEFQARVAKFGPPQLSKNNPLAQQKNIAHSGTNRDSLLATAHVEGPLSEKLNTKVFNVQHRLLYNGLNDNAFMGADGTHVVLTHAVAGSSDRENPNISMARKVAPFDPLKLEAHQPSYCYTGRPDSEGKALEQAQMIFFSELDAEEQGKGLKKLDDGSYELTYVVTSLMANSPLYGVGRLFRGKGQAPEHLLFESEQQALFKVRKQGVHTFHRNGKAYQVRLKPILFSRQINLFANLEGVLDPTLSGEMVALEASRRGWKELRPLLEERTKTLAEEEKKLANALITRLEKSLNGRYIGSQIDSVEEIFYRAMLLQLCGLPVVYHCKSSIDRTGMVVALHVALEQWRSSKQPFSMELIDDPDFKELFMMNWVQGHQISRNARGTEGVITDEKGKTVELDGEQMMMFAGEGINQCTPIARLVPERYLKSYGISEFLFNHDLKVALKNWALFIGILLLEAFLCPFTTAINPNGTLSIAESSGGDILLKILRYPVLVVKTCARLYAGFVAALPSKVINPEHPDMQAWGLTKGTHSKAFDKPLQAVPANGTTQEEYETLFNQRMSQNARTLRHRIQGVSNPETSSTAHQFLQRLFVPNNTGGTLESKKWEPSKKKSESDLLYLYETHTIKPFGEDGKVYTIVSKTITRNNPDKQEYGAGVIVYWEGSSNG